MLMRKDQVFRPQLTEILEPRAVPSMAGVTLATHIPGITVTLPSQVSPANPQVKAAFATFDQSYIRAVDTILLAPGPDGLVVPSNNRAAFVTAIEKSLHTFAEQLVLSLGTGSTTPAGSGTGGRTARRSRRRSSAGRTAWRPSCWGCRSRRSRLSVPNTSAGSGASTQALVPNAVTTAEQIRVTNRVPVAESVGPATTGADTTSSTSPSSPSTKAADDVRSAFGNFLDDYFQSVQGVLLAPGSNGQVNPQANRAAFDAKVAQSLQSLETQLTASLGRYPATSSLGPQIRAAIEGAGASSLQGQLANLATPQGAQAAVVRDFTLGSARTIAQALSLINGDDSKLVGPARP